MPRTYHTRLCVLQCNHENNERPATIWNCFAASIQLFSAMYVCISIVHCNRFANAVFYKTRTFCKLSKKIAGSTGQGVKTAFSAPPI